jgi:hypothetical protein
VNIGSSTRITENQCSQIYIDVPVASLVDHCGEVNAYDESNRAIMQKNKNDSRSNVPTPLLSFNFVSNKDFALCKVHEFIKLTFDWATSTFEDLIHIY